MALPPEILELYPYLLPNHPSSFPEIGYLLRSIMYSERDIYYYREEPTENDFIHLWDSLLRPGSAFSSFHEL